MAVETASGFPSLTLSIRSFSFSWIFTCWSMIWSLYILAFSGEGLQENKINAAITGAKNLIVFMLVGCFVFFEFGRKLNLFLKIKPLHFILEGFFNALSIYSFKAFPAKP